MSRNVLCIVLCFVFTAFTLSSTGYSAGRILFEEDWDTSLDSDGHGFIDPARWIQENADPVAHPRGGATGGPFVFNLHVTGQSLDRDFALYMQDGPQNAEIGVRSVMDFFRSSAPGGLKVSLKMFGGNGNPSAKLTGLGGPWSNTTSPSATFPAYEDIEAGFSRQEADGRNYYTEDAPGANDWATVPFSAAFDAAYLAAINKPTAIDVSVTVGNPTGAKFEWSVAGGPVTVEYDTLGQVAGTNWQGANTVSDTDPLRLYFASFGNTGDIRRTIIDDIVVRAIPEPSSLILVGLAISPLLTLTRRGRH